MKITDPYEGAASLAILAEDGRELLAIHRDGTVTGAVEDASEAGARFVAYLRAHVFEQTHIPTGANANAVLPDVDWSQYPHLDTEEKRRAYQYALASIESGGMISPIPFEQAHTPTEHECTWACWVDRYGQDHHAPTDDEREALARVAAKLDRIPDSDAVTLDKTDARTLLAAARRTVQGEPTCMTEHPITGFRCSQPAGPRHAHVCDLPPTVQGEPTDAVIVDMLTAFYGEERDGWSMGKVRRMRAALIAAREAGEK